jgi:chemotaxis response regulator CheB
MKRKIEKEFTSHRPITICSLKKKNFSLTIDERVNFARPSIDVLFESAAEAYKTN